MNMAVRELPHIAPKIDLRRVSVSWPAKPNFGALLLALVVLISALSVVYLADLNRRLFMQVQTEQAAQNQMHLDWGKLLLEQTTWSTQARVQALAQERLGMVAPTPANTVLVKL
jgi:cell division protein FtsL